MAVLVDTNLFLALAFPRDINHSRARSAMRTLTEHRIVVAPVLPELFYLMTQRMGYARAVASFDLLRTPAFRIETLLSEDMARMREIMEQYSDNAFDFVDTAIMAVSERLSITDVYTFDRRDFTVFNPRHCPALALMPL